MRRIQIAAILLMFLPVSSFAENCRYYQDINVHIDLSDLAVSTAALKTSAGDKKIHGVDNASEATITGRACASSEEVLAETRLIAERRGQQLYIETVHPDTSAGYFDERYAYVNFELEMPSYLVLDLRDKSGDVTISGVAGGLRVEDNSGDLDISDTAGEFRLSDHSGDISIRRHQGELVIEDDRSGDIQIDDVSGSVQIGEDRSGDISVRHVTHNVTIGRDSSGNIEVYDIGGNFSVDSDGSGEVSYERVDGSVDIPERKR